MGSVVAGRRYSGGADASPTAAPYKYGSINAGTTSNVMPLFCSGQNTSSCREEIGLRSHCSIEAGIIGRHGLLAAPRRGESMGLPMTAGLDVARVAWPRKNALRLG